MKKVVAFLLIFLSLFLVACWKNSSISDTWSWVVVEQKEDPNDITTQKWYKQRISQREKDLDAFYQTLTKFDNEQLAKLPCKDYYPTNTEHFKSLYEDEQKMIQEYAKKCENLQQTALISTSSSGSNLGTWTQVWISSR
jgi:hypothetical protein